MDFFRSALSFVGAGGGSAQDAFLSRTVVIKDLALRVRRPIAEGKRPCGLVGKKGFIYQVQRSTWGVLPCIYRFCGSFRVFALSFLFFLLCCLAAVAAGTGTAWLSLARWLRRRILGAGSEWAQLCSQGRPSRVSTPWPETAVLEHQCTPRHFGSARRARQRLTPYI